MDRYLLYGKTTAGRYLFVVLERMEDTARKTHHRDMTHRKKRNFRRLNR